MLLRLREGVSWCVCAGRAVFLDLERDRFFCLPPEQDAAFQHWAHDPASLPADICGLLIRSGLLVPNLDRGADSGPAIVPAPGRDLAAAPGSVGLCEIGAAILAQHRAARLLRRRALRAILASPPPLPRSQPAGTAAARAQRLAKAFAAAGMIVRTADLCLPRAIAMRDRCHRAGLLPLLVFGVRRDPFAAHCWVQLDDAVLVGDLEQVRLFTPIRVVR